MPVSIEEPEEVVVVEVVLVVVAEVVWEAVAETVTVEDRVEVEEVLEDTVVEAVEVDVGSKIINSLYLHFVSFKIYNCSITQILK